MEPKALVVDDRSESRSLVAGHFSDAGFDVVEARDGLEAWDRFRDSGPDVVVSDLRMPGVDGLELLRRIRTVSSTPVILFTARRDIAAAVAAIKGGAQEFLAFPDDLGRMVDRARGLVDSRESRAGAGSAARIVGDSQAAQRLRDRVLALAPLQVPVFVSGETGVGHDHVVRCLHDLSDRGGSLLAVGPGDAGQRRHCSAGAFYLDEVARFAPADQVYWYERLREAHPDAVAAPRFYASSSEDLALLVRNDSFHSGLARRLLRFRIPVAPLRERAEDVGPLVAHHAERIGREMGRVRVRFDPAAIAVLRTRSWPGNVRELVAVVEKLVAFSPGGDVTRDRVREVLGESPDSVATLRDRRSQQQRAELVTLLESCGGNLAEVARRLGMSRGAVIYRAQKFGLLPRPS